MRKLHRIAAAMTIGVMTYHGVSSGEAVAGPSSSIEAGTRVASGLPPLPTPRPRARKGVEVVPAKVDTAPGERPPLRTFGIVPPYAVGVRRDAGAPARETVEDLISLSLAESG